MVARQQHSNQINTFKTAFRGGTRPNRFIINDDSSILGPNNSLLVKAGSMPPHTVGVLQIPYRGRVAKMPGDRAYAEWTFTVIDDKVEDGKAIYEKMVTWHEKFNSHKDNVAEDGVLDGLSTEFKQWTVTQLDMTGTEFRVISLINCWPVEVGAINLSYDTADVLTEYSCTLAYDYLEVNPTAKPSTGGGGSPGGGGPPPAGGGVGPYTGP